MATLLTADGVLYLGVNGATFQRNVAPSPARFRLRSQTFTDSYETRQFLKLCDALAGHERLVAKQPAEFLAGDLFGPLINNRPLEEWIELAGRSELHFRGSYGAHRALRRIFNEDLYDSLIPRSRADAHRMAERLAPAHFHQLVFTRAKALDVPWLDHDRLLSFSLRTTGLYQMRLPKQSGSTRGLRALRLTSPATNTLVELKVPSWILEILRKENAARPLHEVLRGHRARISANALQRHLYLLELLGAINLSPVT